MIKSRVGEEERRGECAVDGCNRFVFSRGWCQMHYRRWQKTGSTALRTVEQRLWGKVNRTAAGCWNWTASTRNGYGAISVAGRKEYTHRLAYQLTWGDIPKDLVVRHRCDNRLCVNPDHLEVGTALDNMRDMVERGRSAPNPRAANTQCPKGHPFDEINTYWWNGIRQCRACKNGYQRSKRDRAAPARIRKVVGEERDHLRSLAAARHADGLTIKEIASEIGRSRALVQHLLKEAGVRPRPRNYRRAA